MGTALICLPLEHPFDALKTNMQSHQTRLSATISNMLKGKGWRAFYNGFSMNALRVAIKQAYRWPLVISISGHYRRSLPSASELVRQSLAGFTIASVELVVLCPFERIKVWLMTTSTLE
jgi:hypothetical protein